MAKELPKQINVFHTKINKYNLFYLLGNITDKTQLKNIDCIIPFDNIYNIYSYNLEEAPKLKKFIKTVPTKDPIFLIGDIESWFKYLKYFEKHNVYFIADGCNINKNLESKITNTYKKFNSVNM